MRFLAQALLFCSISILTAQDLTHANKIDHIFWQEEVELKVEDFQNNGLDIPNAIKYCDTIGLCTVGAFGTFAVLDIPKKKKQRGKLLEQLYIVPAFEPSKSYRVKEDSLGAEKQQVVFDIYELSARWMRRELSKLQETTGTYGTLSIWFKTVENDAAQITREMVDGFTYEVFIDPQPDAIRTWKEHIDEMLLETQEFATSTDDVLRFTRGQPILENYEMAQQLMGDLFD